MQVWYIFVANYFLGANYRIYDHNPISSRYASAHEQYTECMIKNNKQDEFPMQEMGSVT